MKSMMPLPPPTRASSFWLSSAKAADSGVVTSAAGATSMTICSMVVSLNGELIR